MRLLHTSDWHLGRSLLSVNLLEHQWQFIDWLVLTAEAQNVDAIVIAGDVYDRAVPPTEAVQLLEDALLRLSRIAPVVLVPGNHDSPTRLGFAGPLLEASGVHIRSSRQDAHRPVLFEAEKVAVYGIPFLHPDLHHRDLGVDRTHEAVLGEVLDRIRHDLDARPGFRSVLVGHAFVTGGEGSDSERDVSVGGIGDVPAAIFGGFDYVALGHLHRAQSIASPHGTRVEYSGSPLAYSFSEESHRKSVTIVEITNAGVLEAIRLEVPAPRKLSTIRGELEQLLADPLLEPLREDWIRAVITDARRPPDCMDRIRTRFPHAIELNFEPASSSDGVLTDVDAVNPMRADPIDVASAFIQYVTGTQPTDDERALLAASIDALRAGQVPT